MNKFNILLIGGGQLGSRHLQGLARSEFPLDIYIIEPDESNLGIAIQRFREVEQMAEIVIRDTVASVNALPVNQFDLVIIATNANVRAEITADLINRHDIKNIIFEKVAFQSEEQFEQVIDLLRTRGIKSWVNCPRRFFPFYQNLRNELKDKGPIHLELGGIEWGLACNSVHFIDLLAFLSGDPVFEPKPPELENQIFESKRKGYIEFFGTISGKSASGNTFTITCLKKQDPMEAARQTLRLEYNDGFINIMEGAGLAEFFTNQENIPFRSEPVKILYQSGLTHLQAKDILHTGKSSLPTLEESFEIHKPLLRILKEHYFKVTGKEIINLPIT